MEPQKHIPALDPINNELSELSLIPEFKSFCPRIWEIMDTIRDIYAVLGSKGLSQFDVPIRYLQNFLTRYNKELKSNTDIANVMLAETLDTVQSYINALKKMAKEAPEKPQHEQPKGSWLPFKNIFSSAPIKRTSCTIEEHGMVGVLQKGYSCATCKLDEERLICEGCASKCHAGHKIQSRGEVVGFCDCRYETTLCQLQEACTASYSGTDMIAQNAFVCETCKMDVTQGEMICHYCAQSCHKGHITNYLGMTGSGFCDCKDLFKFCHQHKRKNK